LTLSRVTLGADVAITSVVLENARHLFPKAERVLLGPPKVRELFGGDSGLRIRDLPYESAGGLLERLSNWLPLLAAIQDEIRDLRREEIVLLDPDSRFLQLGLLPALRDESRYLFFESRSYGAGTSHSLSRLTQDWLNQQFGQDHSVLPTVSLRESDRSLARQLCGQFFQADSRKLVAVSFGVGGNLNKRLPDPFEQQLLCELLRDGCTVVLDKGGGGHESDRAQTLVHQLAGEGWLHAGLDARQTSSRSDLTSCRLFTWHGGIGVFSALTAESDEYIGYDSSGQHIAAALGVPTISIFSRIAPEIFRNRWRATGRGIAKQVTELDSNGAVRPVAAVLDEVMQIHRSFVSR
jgi:ADP-heptose:LPS heptosyltransferase